MEDITYVDSYTHEILAMNDGSYITIENGTEILHGKAYHIKDGNNDILERKDVEEEIKNAVKEFLSE